MINTAPACQSLTIGASGFDPSYVCEECGEPVCDSCRARPQYASLFDKATMTKAVIDKAYTLGSIYESAFTQQHQYRYERYCDNCQPAIVEKMAQTETGKPRECECHDYGHNQIERLCVPCLKKRSQRSEGHNAAAFICTSRKKVPGCLRASRSWSRVCVWCRGFSLKGGRSFIQEGSEQ
jgi:hypothetical protein